MDGSRAHEQVSEDAGRAPVDWDAVQGGPGPVELLAGNAAVARLLGGAPEVSRQDLSSQGAGPLAPDTADAIQAEHGGGAALPAGVRTDMEARFGADFSAVRVHTGSRAVALNRAVQAQAFTTGTDIFFRGSGYDPASGGGRELLAHELAHVVQQSPSPGGGARVSDPREPAETAAREVGRSVARHPRAQQSADPRLLTELQRTAGNQAVVGLMSSVQRQDAPPAGEPAPVTITLGGSTHVVLPGDSLWTLAESTYGDGNHWREIVAANPGKVGREDCLILNSSELFLPEIEVPVASGAGAPAPRGPVSPAGPAGGGNPTSNSRTCLWPAFRFNLWPVPVSIAPVPTPAGLLVFTLGLRGNFNLQKDGTCLPWSVDQTGIRLEANEVVNQFTYGLRLNGIGSSGVSIGTTFAGEFSSTEVRHTPPSTWTFIAQTRNIGFDFSGWRVRGDFGFELRVDHQPGTPVPTTEPTPTPESSPGDWEAIFGAAVGVAIIAGAVALIAGTLAEDVATGMTGVADDPISFATAAKMLKIGGALVAGAP